jgi:cytochrome c
MLAALIVTACSVSAAHGLAQDAAAGERSFAKCRACHQIGPTAKNGVGPNLNGLFGRATGSIAGYSYSAANKGAGFTWDESRFAAYIKNPKASMPGTKMVFAGIANDGEIAGLTAYLKQFAADGSRMP